MKDSTNQDLPETIIYPEAFKRSPAANFDGVFDWSWTDGCFGKTNIRPMDIDGVVEKKGNFLIFETKDIGVSVKDGQRLTLYQLWLKGNVTVMFVYGKRNPEMCICWYPKYRSKEPKTCTLDGKQEAIDFVKRWYRYANG